MQRLLTQLRLFYRQNRYVSLVLILVLAIMGFSLLNWLLFPRAEQPGFNPPIQTQVNLSNLVPGTPEWDFVQDKVEGLSAYQEFNDSSGSIMEINRNLVGFRSSLPQTGPGYSMYLQGEAVVIEYADEIALQRVTLILKQFAIAPDYPTLIYRPI